MISAALIALTLAAGASDPCAPVEPAGAPDPAAAAEYRAVGDAERQAGSRETAAAAYRAALARDGGDAHARAALAALCAEEHAAGAYERGLRLMEAGDRKGAVAAFEEARAAKPDAAAALLEGICRYEDGDDALAAPLLAEAAADPAHRDAARFFQGLVALRGGRSRDAAELLEASAADRHLAPFAAGLARDARRDGRLVLSMILESGWDSNVEQTPDGAPRSAATSDGSWGGTAVGRWSPLGDTGPFVRGDATLRDELHYDPYDLRSLGAAAGWQAGRGGRYAVAEWAYDHRDLGGTPYLDANRLLGGVRLALGRAWTVGVTYAARFESYRTAADAPYSGLRHLGEADVTFDVAPRSTLTFAWHAGRDATKDATLSWWEQGPRVALRWQLAPDYRLGLDWALSFRPYDEVDPALRVRRSDTIVDAAALLEWELSDRFTLRVSTTLRQSWSNAAAFTYTQVVPMIGLAYTVGLL